jgi:hypothetical protein
MSSPNRHCSLLIVVDQAWRNDFRIDEGDAPDNAIPFEARDDAIFCVDAVLEVRMTVRSVNTVSICAKASLRSYALTARMIRFRRAVQLHWRRRPLGGRTVDLVPEARAEIRSPCCPDSRPRSSAAAEETRPFVNRCYGPYERAEVAARPSLRRPYMM